MRGEERVRARESLKGGERQSKYEEKVGKRKWKWKRGRKRK